MDYKYKGKESEYNKEYQRKYKQTPNGKESQRKWRQSPKCKKYMKKWGQSPKGKESDRKKKDQCINSWKDVIPKQSNCEVCGQVIIFNSKNKDTTIHFDHRHGGIEPIIGNPSNWMRGRSATPKNILIWKSCDFGMLCNRCNFVLPTVGRVEFLNKLLKYTTK